MCIDFLPDGRLLVASSANRQLLRREPDGSLVPHADLDPVSMKPWNDIVVNGGGMPMSTASVSTSQGTTVGTDDRDQSEKHPSALSTGLARPGWRSPAGRFRSMQLAAGWSEWGIKLAQRVCPAQRVGGRACRVGAQGCWQSRRLPEGSRIAGGSNVLLREEACGGSAEDHRDILFHA